MFLSSAPKICPTTVCTRPATTRIFNLGLLAKSLLVEAHFAHPQAGETGALAPPWRASPMRRCPYRVHVPAGPAPGGANQAIGPPQAEGGSDHANS